MESISWELALKPGTIHNYSNTTHKHTWRAYYIKHMENISWELALKPRI